MASLPTGTVTFLFTDIEGSTHLLQILGDRYTDVIAKHHRLLRAAFKDHGGQEIRTQGDAFFVVFPRARDAISAAVAAQRAIMSHPWPEEASVRLRMGLHTGEPIIAETGYEGMDVHRAARICSNAHGGQIIVSDATHALVAKDLPEGVSLRELGEYRFKDLAHAHRLFQVVAVGLPTDFPSLKSLNVLPNNLPIQLTSFIGRGRAKAEVRRLLSATRFVTLMGSGGAGKTRLALQVAAEALEDFPDGVWLVELAALSDPDLIPQAAASALGVPEQPGRSLTETLADYLRSKSALVILDNCEHLVVACTRLTNVLLRTCPNLRILATSREVLGVTGESTWQVPSLSLPDPEHLPSLDRLKEYEAVRLFIDRAVASAPQFAMTSTNAIAVAQVCHRLDGIPLAIELAAARVKVLAVEQIAARLDDRFRLLTGGSRTALPRHQTLQATMDWSYGLLLEREQAMLRRLSVFAGGCTLEAAEAICAGNGVTGVDILDLLATLVDKSLVLTETLRGATRYRLLETVRQYGRERLIEAGEATAFLNRHLDWYLAFGEQAELELRGSAQRAWLARLESEHDNLRAALVWSQATVEGVEAGLRLGAALRVYWLRRGHWSEGRRGLEGVLSRGAAQQFSSSFAKALYAAAQLAEAQDRDAEARTYCEEAMAVYRQLQDKVGTALSLHSLGMVAHKHGDQATARSYFEESLALFRESGDKSGIATVLDDLAEVAAIEGDNNSAHLMLVESLAIRRELGDMWGIGVSLNDLGQLARLRGDHKQAATLYQESLASHLQSGSKAGIAWVRYNLGVASLHLSDYRQAYTFFRESLTGYLELESNSGIGEAIGGLGSLAIARGRPKRGARLLSISERLLELADHTLDLVDRIEFSRNVAAVRALLNEEEFNAIWGEGRAMTLEDAVEYALKEGQSDQ